MYVHSYRFANQIQNPNIDAHAHTKALGCVKICKGTLVITHVCMKISIYVLACRGQSIGSKATEVMQTYLNLMARRWPEDGQKMAKWCCFLEG